MKKILFVLGGFSFGGTVFSTLNMISFLKERYDIYILPMKPYGPVREYYQNYTILDPGPIIKAIAYAPINLENNFGERIKIFIFRGIRYMCKKLGIDFVDYEFKREAKRIMKRYHFDFVASTQELSSTYFVRHFEGTKKIAWFRSEYSVYKDLLTEKQLEEEQKIYRTFDKIVCVSKTTRNDFCMYFKDIGEKVVAIHNIQNTDNIIQKSSESVSDAFNKDVFNIVSVGRIAKQKQFYLIPMIAHKLKNEYKLDFKWYIIGDGNVYGERERLEEALKKYDNRNYVICMGSRLNPYPYIASADLLVNTSYYEACPRVVAEAKILHTPVVCSDFSSAREFVDNDVDGFVGTIEELPEIISKLVSDKALYQRIKKNCDNYSIDNDIIMNQLMSVFS